MVLRRIESRYWSTQDWVTFGQVYQTNLHWAPNNSNNHNNNNNLDDLSKDVLLLLAPPLLPSPLLLQHVPRLRTDSTVRQLAEMIMMISPKK